MAAGNVNPPPARTGSSAKRTVTVSAKGLANGLSIYWNDGADYGPDTPGTTSSGIAEGDAAASLLLIPLEFVETDGNPYNISGGNTVSLGPWTGRVWTGSGMDNITIQPTGSGWAGKDMINFVAQGSALQRQTFYRLGFSTNGKAVLNLCNFANPGPETSTRWLIKECLFQGNSATGFNLVMDKNEDSAIEDCIFIDGPAAPSITNASLSVNIPAGMGIMKKTVMTAGVNRASAYFNVIQYSWWGCLLPPWLYLTRTTGGAKSPCVMVGCFQQNQFGTTNPSIQNSGTNDMYIVLIACYFNPANSQPVLGGTKPWHITLFGCTFVGDASTIDVALNSVANTVVNDLGLNIYNNGVRAPTVGGNARQNWGTGSVTAATTVVVTHGLGAAPVIVLASPTSAPGAVTWYISAMGATTFTITFSASFTGTFNWFASLT